jgi:hypothetical protein
MKKGISKTEAAEALLGIYSSFEIIKKQEKIEYENKQDYALYFLVNKLGIDKEKSKFFIEYLEMLYHK